MSRLFCVLFLLVGCSNFGPPATVEIPSETSGALDATESAESFETEAAIASLTRMSEFLAAQTSLRFESEISYDAVQHSGEKVEFGSHRRISLRRPDGAQFDVSHWNGVRELLTFDGKRLSAAIPQQGAYASIPFDGRVGEAIDHLVSEYGIAAPLSDLLRRDFASEVANRMQSAGRLGRATISGVLCDHLIFQGEKVDLQIYIRQGDEPVPVRFVIDYHEEPGQPQFRAGLTNWELSPDLPDSVFQLRPPPGAQHVDFDELLDLLHGPLDSRGDEQ